MRNLLLLSTVSALCLPALTRAQDVRPPAVAAPQTESVHLADIVVVAPDRLAQIAGAVTLLSAADYRQSQPFALDDILRRVPGLYVRGEEGLALRPNVGIRGLTPIRSTEVLFLEDGVPLAYAPYGDNASYYHPPIERFSGVQVLRGSAQIAFGPHTVGGVINYTTPNPSEDLEGRLVLRGGNRGNREVTLQASDTVGETGILGMFTRRESEGNRDNQDLSYDDLFVKLTRPISASQNLTLKASWLREDSQVTYSGLTEAEYAADPRQNPFGNDRFEAEHMAASAVHAWRLTDTLRLTTALYGATFQRDWWRQSSNSGQRPNDASDPACGGMANLNTTCGNEGRLRDYYSFGIDSRLAWDWATAGRLAGRLEAGVRLHRENQERLQWNGDTPTARRPGVGRNAGVVEDNTRRATAMSGFVQNSFVLGDLTITPGLRLESIEFERANNLPGGGRGQRRIDVAIPGLGFAWSRDDRLTAFAGVHRGFSPPRAEDIITNTGGSVELDAEQSTNWEAGLRARPAAGVALEATAFRMDFDNQIVPSSVAGGVGATLTSAGETLHQGLEFAGRFSSAEAFGSELDWYADATLTWVAQAEYVGRRFSSLSGFGAVSVTGNRLPYAPEWFGRAAFGVRAPSGLQAEVEVVQTGEMFADDLNTVAPTANGQRGLIPDATVINLAGSWALPNTSVRLLARVRNVADRTYIIDRARGILPNEPRIVQIGVEYAF